MRYSAVTLILISSIVIGMAISAHPATFRSAASQNPEQTAEQHLAAGREAIVKKDYKRAEKELKRALSLKKEFAEASLLLGVAYSNRRKYKDAIKYVRESIKHKPNSPEAHYLLARLLLLSNDLAGAREAANTAISQGGRFASLYFLAGDIDLASGGGGSPKESRAGRFESAVKYYDEGLRLAPANDPQAPAIRERVEAIRNYLAFRSHQDDPAYQKPVPLNTPRPNYTETARQNRTQGVVRLMILINEQGQVTSILPLSRLGDGLDEEAFKATKALKFTPATKDGQVVPFWTFLEVEFKLK